MQKERPAISPPPAERDPIPVNSDQEEEDGQWAREMEKAILDEEEAEKIHETIRKLRQDTESAGFEPVTKKQKKRNKKYREKEQQ